VGIPRAIAWPHTLEDLANLVIGWHQVLDLRRQEPNFEFFDLWTASTQRDLEEQ
jgi:hypothetical protein